MNEQNEPSQGQLVVQPTAGFRPADFLPVKSADLHLNPAIYSTLKPDTAKAKGELYDLVISGGDNAAEWVNKTFTIRDVVIFPVAKTNEETGEVIPLPMMILLTTDGERIKTCSTGVWSSLQMLRACGFTPFGQVCQPVTLRQIAVGEGKSMYRLDRANTGTEEKPPANNKRK